MRVPWRSVPAGKRAAADRRAVFFIGIFRLVCARPGVYAVVCPGGSGTEKTAENLSVRDGGCRNQRSSVCGADGGRFGFSGRRSARFVLNDRSGAGGTVHFIWIQWGAGEKRTAGFEMVLLWILSVASAFVVAGGPGNGNDVAAVWKRAALIHDNRMLAERAFYCFNAASERAV